MLVSKFGSASGCRFCSEVCATPAGEASASFNDAPFVDTRFTHATLHDRWTDLRCKTEGEFTFSSPCDLLEHECVSRLAAWSILGRCLGTTTVQPAIVIRAILWSKDEVICEHVYVW